MIYEKAAREKKALNFARYAQESLDAPISFQTPIPRLELLRSGGGDFQNGVCLLDYVDRLPSDARFLARRFMDGDTMDEVRDLNPWERQRAVCAMHVLKETVEQYCLI